jgi:type IV secretory pathway ATPase VirB11/archaellum biosynthesis ATPase
LHVYFQALSQRQYKQIFQSYRMAAKLSFLVSERVIATALGKVSRGKTDLRKRIALLVNLEFRKHEPDV